MAHYNVIIATPAKLLHREYVHSLIDTTNELNRLGISWRWINNFSSHVGFARELVYEMIKPDTYNKIFWIDSDMSWKPQDFLQLYYSNKDIITGAYVGTARFICAATEMDKAISRIEILNAKDLIEIKHCGFGFICVKYGVHESLSYPIFQSVVHNGQLLYSEDVSWCIRVRNKKYKIWLDPAVRVTHYKERELIV